MCHCRSFVKIPGWGPERSGLYYLHAETESGLFYAFPWVVAPATPSAQVAVLASTNTWNAYNSFGGRSTNSAKWSRTRR